MNVSRWERVKDVVYQAMQLDPDQRQAFVEHACADIELRDEVQSLLQAENAVRPDFLQAEHHAESLGDKDQAASGILQPGQIFSDRFKLIRKLGEGGMGQVWLCEQTTPVCRQVALKLIKAGMYDEAVLRRFQAERQSLAIMEHPAIAKVYEAGTTPQGQPYFVMEYVPGLPITEYCDHKKLGITERLELFIQVCEGVQHAHQKAIIHRDLKPANILIVEVNGKPTPRIIDFGLAKAAIPVDGQSLFTQPGSFIGTPAFMSPEQADPNVSDVDTRTDVYSLGVILYVLLAGSQPFASGRQKLPVHELLRRLREDEPPRPSIKVSSDHATSTVAAEARGTDPKQLASRLRGDLDWITLKAVEKDRTLRYGSPSELANDLRRHLNHEPVLARPASTGYRIQKYVRRHRIAVSVAASLVLLLAAFAAVQAIQLRRITAERDRANRERDRANRITDFMTGMFKVSDPSEARGNTVTAREIMDKASNDMGRGLARDPEVQSQLMWVMALTYANLGLNARAHELAQQALEIRQSTLGRDNPKTLESVIQLGDILEREGHYPEAEKLERQALALERRDLAAGDSLMLDTMDRLAVVLVDEGIYEEAEQLDDEVLEVRRRRNEPPDSQTLRAMNNLGTAFGGEGQYANAEQEYRQLLEVSQQILGPDHPQTLGAMGNLAVAIERQNRFGEAEQLFRQVLANSQRVMGPEHRDTVLAMTTLAEVLTSEDRLAEAEKLYRQALRISSRTLGPDHPDTLADQSSFADLLFKERHLREAEQLQRATLTSQLRVQGPESPDVFASQSALAKTLNVEGHYVQAEKIGRDSLTAELRALGPQHPLTLQTLQQLGTAMAYEHRYPEAAKLFRDVIDRQSNAGAKDSDFQIWYSFACVATAADRPNEALQYLRDAARRGYKDGHGLMTDDDLKALRHNPDFLALAANLNRISVAAQAKSPK